MKLFVENGRFEIDPTEPDADESPDIQPPLGEPVNGLIAVTRNAAGIHTGIKKGTSTSKPGSATPNPPRRTGPWSPPGRRQAP
ncbi:MULTISPECIES: hypothetical protein [unclassified Streptomyces]|uniref:hypothetical protein n=1 Tax=unclassified Streptomyces TaxID=2593676 RepID=UPI0036FE9CF8